MRRAWNEKAKGKRCLPLLETLKIWGLDVQCERKFDWLILPKAAERNERETLVAETLIEHCRATRGGHPKKAAADPGRIFADERIKGRTRRLEFDFFLPALNIAIEFDERQHFTAERRITFDHYDGLSVHFDTGRWKSLCSDTIRDSDPPSRDWDRAFRDAVRDIRSTEHGVKLLRVYHRDCSELCSAGSRLQASFRQQLGL